jgi:NAD(P)-dependent dehydrogenase (short-subunit alcohol dehydrogenase family)
MLMLRDKTEQRHRRNSRGARPDGDPAAEVVPAQEFADVAARQALLLPLTPDDTAAVVATLVGHDAAAMTGQTLTVDGGPVPR